MNDQPEVAEWKEAIARNECALKAALKIDAGVMLGTTVIAYCIQCSHRNMETQVFVGQDQYFADVQLSPGSRCRERQREELIARRQRAKAARYVETLQLTDSPYL